jgi:serine/threonine protein kinase, bacterial
MSETAQDFRAGSRFGPYRLRRLLGRGGMGEVYEALDTVKDRVVALKLMSPKFSRDPVFRARMQREAHTAGRLQEPHVVPIHDYGEIDGQLFIDMRMVEGADLHTLLHRFGPLTPPRAVAILRQVASALDAAHAAGVMHRDVKPENILITSEDFAYLVDFGIAAATTDERLTQLGTTVGTWKYMAPERFTNAELTYRADIYSLACVLHECLTGAPPYPGDSAGTLVTAHLYEPIPKPSGLRPGIPKAFDQVIARGMAKNPDERYPTAGELMQAAHRALSTPGQDEAVIRMRRSQEVTLLRRSQQSTLSGTAADLAASLTAPTPAPATAPTPAPAATPPKAIATARPERSSEGPTEKTRSPWRSWLRRKTVLTSAAVLTVAAIVAAAVIATMSHQRQESRESHQATLPFTGLREPEGVDVDNGGTVYVADTLHNRVLALSAGATSPAVLPFDGLNYPTGVTADNVGTVYVTDAGNKRVVVLPAGSTTQIELPFTDLGNPTGVTVDSSRTVYVTDTAKNRVVALRAGSNRQTELPFTGLSAPTGVVVNGTGTIYIADGGNNRVLALPADSSTQAALPFTGLKEPGGVTVDSEGAVYVTDSGNNRTLKLPVGPTAQVELPFTGLDYPWGLAVDNGGTVYVAGHNNKVVVLRQK